MNRNSRGPSDDHRSARWFLLLGFLPLCWLGMQIVHEFGHAAVAWFSGTRIIRVVLHPLAISRTDVEPGPYQLAVIWGGPLMGSLLPLVVWSGLRTLKRPSAFLWRFFAGLCLITNGLYLSVGVWQQVGDAGDLVRSGAPTWMLVAFGICTVPWGLWLWNVQSPSFGLGPGAKPVSWRVTLAVWAALALVVLTECALSSSG